MDFDGLMRDLLKLEALKKADLTVLVKASAEEISGEVLEEMKKKGWFKDVRKK